MDADFSAAAVRGNLERIRDILEASPDLNVNIPVEDIFGGTTLLGRTSGIRRPGVVPPGIP